MPGPNRSYTKFDALRFMLKNSDPVFVPSELSDASDVSRETVRKRLLELHEQGHVDRKKPSDKATLYWPTEAGKQYYIDNTDL
jgi:predicted ArsR family transcriptional regulator